MPDIILIIQCLLFEIWEAFENFAHTGEVLNKFLFQRLLPEFGEIARHGQSTEILQVYARFHQISQRFHGLIVDGGEDRIRRLHVLRVLPLKLLQLTDQFFFEASESVRGQCIVIIILLQVLNDVEEFLLAVEMILVGRIGDLVGDAIDHDEILLQPLEDHSAEH